MSISPVKHYDLVYSSKNYESEAMHIRSYIKRLQWPEVFWMLLAARGSIYRYLMNEYHVDGLDINSSYIEVARERNPKSTFWCADMTSFDLSKKYDIVMCLFSAIAYANEYPQLVEALTAMKHHVQPNGYLMIEPWFTPDRWQRGMVSLVQCHDEGVHICRMTHSDAERKASVINFEFLIGTKDGIEHRSEKHKLGLYSHEEMIQAFAEAGLKAAYDPNGITGRGIYIAARGA